jgi:hypothetical protein
VLFVGLALLLDPILRRFPIEGGEVLGVAVDVGTDGWSEL